MKNLFVPVLLIIALTACKSKTKEVANDSLKTPAIVNTKSSEEQSKELIKELKPVLHGIWVQSDFINTIIKTKSPWAAQSLTASITTLIIDTSLIKNDRVEVKVGYGNRDGGPPFTLNFTPGTRPNSILLGSYDLVYNTKNGDTSLVFYYIDKNLNAHEIIKFKKALNQPSDNLSAGMDYLINKGLVVGKYKLIGDGTVEFTDNGKVKGLANFKTYYIKYHLGNAPMTNLDEIDFNVAASHFHAYSFKILTDTLDIYETYGSPDSTKLLLGKLKYKLVRKK